MRQFLLGIAATVVGGFILFWVTNWYTEWANTEQHMIDYHVDVAAGFVGNSEINALLAIAKDPNASGKIAILSIKNNSDEDVQNAEFLVSPTEAELSSKNLHGFDLAHYESGDMPSPTMLRVPEGIKIIFPLLEKITEQHFG